MNRKLERVSNSLISALLLLCLVGCSIGSNTIQKREISRKDLLSTVCPIIEAQKAVISQELDLGEDFLQYSGEEIAAKALTEENGKEYLEFCYEVDRSSDPRMVLERAKNLIGEEQYAELLKQTEQLEKQITQDGDVMAKGLPVNQREAFTKDVKKLLVKSVVLLTAGIVYACIPNVIFWGKISAAAAIAVAAGALVVTVMAIYEYYQFGRDAEESFKTWLQEVMTLPQAEYAIATSIISMGTTLKQGPVVSGLVVCVFAIYKAIDMIRPMLQIYNFNV